MLKDDFLKEAKSIKRDGINKLLEYLEDKTDFFSAPASTKYHGAYEEGLLEHTLAVFDIALEQAQIFELKENIDSIKICALFHDVCKANFYVKGKRNQKIDGKWIDKEVWEVKDQFPLGHGEKSLFLVQKYIELTNEEALAVRWHLGGFDPAYHTGYPSGYSCLAAMNAHKLVSLIQAADFMASYLLQK